MRDAFIKTLTKEAAKNKRIVLLTGDLGYTVFEDFAGRYPDRFFNVGVAEQNMVGIAAGLALSGKIVFVYSIATFSTMRPFEQIRTDVGFHDLPVTIVGTGGGLSYAHLSITHHSTEDIGLMREIPGMSILCPADPIEAAWATKRAIALKKPVYLRLGKKGEPILYDKTPMLQYGKGSLLRDGGDVAILATGNIVYNVMKAAELLAKKGIEAKVISMHTVKPIDQKLIERLAKEYSHMVTVEEHNIIGGLGSSVAEILAKESKHAKLLRLGIPDIFTVEIGSHEFLRNRLGLDPKGITNSVLRFIKH